MADLDAIRKLKVDDFYLADRTVCPKGYGIVPDNSDLKVMTDLISRPIVTFSLRIVRKLTNE